MSDRPPVNAAKRPASTRRVAVGLVTAALVAIAFLGLMPALADYDEVWRAIQDISIASLGLLAMAGALSQLIGAWPTMVVIPTLTLRRSLYWRLVTTAAANTIPGGGAVGVGLTYVMLGRWGHSAAEIGASVVLTGVWNNLARMLLPAAALLAAVLTGVDMPSLAQGSLLGIVSLLITAAAIVVVLRSRLKYRVIGPIDRFVAWVRRTMGKPVHPADSPSENFLRVIADAVGTRWMRLMLVTVGYHLSLYVCLEVSLRVVGVTAADVHWAESLAAFSLVRLISTVPLTPGSLGVTEVGLTGLLTIGLDAGHSALVAAGILVFRFVTYAVPTVAGAIAAIAWSRSKAE